MNREEEIEKLCDILESNIDILESSADAVDYNLAGVKNAANEIASMMDDICKETAKEIWEEVLSFCKENYRSIPDCSWNLDPFLKRKNIIVQVLYERMKSFIKKYGVEVDE